MSASGNIEGLIESVKKVSKQMGDDPLITGYNIGFKNGYMAALSDLGKDLAMIKDQVDEERSSEPKTMMNPTVKKGSANPLTTEVIKPAPPLSKKHERVDGPR